MPVIAVLTKADALKMPAVQQLKEEQGLTTKEAMPKVADVAAHILSKLRRKVENDLKGCNYPPKDYVSMTSGSSAMLWDNHSDMMMIM